MTILIKFSWTWVCVGVVLDYVAKGLFSWLTVVRCCLHSCMRRIDHHSLSRHQRPTPSLSHTPEKCLSVHFVLVHFNFIFSRKVVHLVEKIMRTDHYHILQINFKLPIFMWIYFQNICEVFLKDRTADLFGRGATRHVFGVDGCSNVHEFGHFVHVLLNCEIGSTINVHPVAFWLEFNCHCHVFSVA